jgi:hypothetical protein
MIIDEQRLLLEAGPLEPGAFYIQKCIFLDEGRNIAKGGHCENLSYGGIGVAVNTPYENETWELGYVSEFDEFELKVTDIEKWGHIMSVVPHFFIDYIQVRGADSHGNSGPPDLQKNPTPMTMWFGRSIFQLFKTLREWSFMAEEPFNSNHPMAIYSKMFYDTVEVPQNILDEIDNMPDMHLAKFLKGQDNYKLIPDHPTISQEFKQWILDTCQKYHELTFEEKVKIVLEVE